MSHHYKWHMSYGCARLHLGRQAKPRHGWYGMAWFKKTGLLLVGNIFVSTLMVASDLTPSNVNP